MPRAPIGLAPIALLALMAASPHPHRPKPDQGAARAAAARSLAQAEQDRAAREAAAATAKHAQQQAQDQSEALAADRVRAAATLRRIESAVTTSTDRLQAAEQAEQAASQALAQHQADFSKLLPLVLRMAHFPAESVLAIPGPPERALQGLLIARTLATQLNREAAALAASRDQAASLKHVVTLRAQSLEADQTSQAKAAASLEAQLLAARAQAVQAEESSRKAAQEAASIAARATTLRGAIAAMDQAEARAHIPKPQDTARPATAIPAPIPTPGSLATPVAGRITRGWGQPAEDGPATGLTYATAPGAFVSSPCAGRVAFAAPFRSYGQLVIVECRGGLDIVLAGLARIDATLGRAVRQGEPVGRMAGAAAPILYVELRRGGTPIDPAPFLNTKG